MSKYPLVRTIYLYLFSLVGLILLIIGGVRFVDMGLKAFIFTKAEQEERLMYKQPPVAYPLEKFEGIAQGVQTTITLIEDERRTLDQWLADYKNWSQQRDALDPVTSRRHRDASMNLALILVGLPLYFFHWRIIKKETKDREVVTVSN